MKKLALLFAAVTFAFMSYSQDEAKSYKMYDVIYIKPQFDQIEALGEAMAKHNRAFHNEKPFRAHVWTINSGEYTGWWAWVMGPGTFTDMDSRPDSKEHMKDWISNVMPHVADVANANFYKLDDKVSYIPEDSFTGKEIWTFYDIKPFEGYRFSKMLKQVKEVFVKKEYTRTFEVYRAQFDNRGVGELMIASTFANWAFFDEDNSFRTDFEEVHGEGSWQPFIEEFRDVVVSREDQIAQYIPELSGGTD